MNIRKGFFRLAVVIIILIPLLIMLTKLQTQVTEWDPSNTGSTMDGVIPSPVIKVIVAISWAFMLFAFTPIGWIFLIIILIAFCSLISYVGNGFIDSEQSKIRRQAEEIGELNQKLSEFEKTEK